MERKVHTLEKEKRIHKAVIDMGDKDPCDPRDIDISFCPIDDISYHKDPELPGIRCVQVIPYIGAHTIYLEDRNYIILAGALDVPVDKEPISIYKSENVSYISNGEPKELTLIYSSYDEYLQPCVLYKDEPLIFANSCLITGEDFSSLTMEQCYAIVTSARARCIHGLYSVCVNIRDNMDLIPRLVYDEK